MDTEIGRSIYWDASAVLSTLVRDSHSDAALKWVQKEGLHFVSTLAYAEVISVLDRMEKERILTKVLISIGTPGICGGTLAFSNSLPCSGRDGLPMGGVSPKGRRLLAFVFGADAKNRNSRFDPFIFRWKTNGGGGERRLSFPQMKSETAPSLERNLTSHPD